jgi:hypothetical protein
MKYKLPFEIKQHLASKLYSYISNTVFIFKVQVKNTEFLEF